MAKQYYCFLERFNNYFNRKLIRHETVADYQAASDDSFIPRDSEGDALPFDFNPNDNITTEIIVNSVPFHPDYFLLLDEDEDIVERWFVMEQKRNRQGQWTYYLKRDVLADSYEDLKSAPVFVEKGIVSDADSPILLNNEDVKVNQIKKDEILLKDLSECAWLVMYLKKGVLGSSSIGPNNDGKIPIDVGDDAPYVYEELTTPIASWANYQYLTSNYQVTTDLTLDIYLQTAYGTSQEQDMRYSMPISNPNGSYIASKLRGTSNLSTRYTKESIKAMLDTQFRPDAATIKSQAATAYGYNYIDALSNYDGKIIKDSAGRYFLVKVFEYSAGTATQNVTSANAPTLKTTLNNLWLATGETETPNNEAFKIRQSYSNLRIELQELFDYETVLDFSLFTGKGTSDSPLFDVVCVPYGAIRITAQGGIIDITTAAQRSMSLINSLAISLTSQYVLDIQILPYCPLQNLLSSKRVSLKYLNQSAVQGIYGGDTTDLLLVADSVNFTLDIAKEITPPAASASVSEVFYKKFVNDCVTVRLCSPNYNGLFEINLAKNGGSITKFNVDVTLRPFNPYIHVNPDFTYMYGRDFNDARGLICGGDFSIGMINDNWALYEIQNKNYQAIFDRQIQNLDFNNAIARQEAAFGILGGTVQGGVTGAAGGGIAAGPYGALAGALIGGIASAGGGALDYINLEKRQEENRNFAIDNYNLQLGNVRALPYSITRTSAFTYNNKLFPFVEIYVCSEVEELAYYKKLEFNGMVVGIIDSMANYESGENANYFRAKLIRFTNISEDNHYLQVVNEELLKGVFI